MFGLRIHGRDSASATGGLSVSIALACAIILTGCLPDDNAGRDAERESIVAFQITSEQIQRARKGDRLLPAAPRIARVDPGPVASEPPASMTPVEPPPVEQAQTPPASRPDFSLASFHGALRGLRSGLRQKPVTILHLGDSHIASDRFTGDLREMFQARFGDAGRGLMMPGFPFSYYRARGVKFAKSGAWSAANSFKRAGGLYGVTGVRMTTSQKNARLSLTSENGPFEWAEVTFLTGPKQGSVVVAVDGNGKAAETRSASEGVKRVRIEHKGSKLGIRAAGDGRVTVLSWSVGQNRPGVRYVNLGIPGATADTPRLWDANFVKDDIANLDPDLIVLGFGTNEGFNDGLKIADYEARVKELTGRLLDAAPNASLAIIGPADGARLPRFAKGRKSVSCAPLNADEKRNYGKLKRAGNAKLARWHAPPKLAAVRDALERVAEGWKAHFWDWAEAMGGPCGIHEWTRSKPQLAASDHVHITRAGSRRSAKSFYQSLMAGFDTAGKLASRTDEASTSVSR